MRVIKTFIKLSLPYCAILGCIIVMSRFFIEPFYFPVNLDDCMYNALLNTFTMPELINMLPGDCNGHLFSHFDGRMFSNIYSLLIFMVFKHHWAQYYIYTFLLFLAFICSLNFMFCSLSKTGIITAKSGKKTVLLSAYTACLVYIFLIDGRYEVFYWISSTSNHLLSIIFFVLMLGLILRKQTPLNFILLLILSFCVGQMNEVYALSYCAIWLFLAALHRQKRRIGVLMILFTVAAIVLNLTSPGTISRFNVLYDISTHFNFISALEDTADTFLLPFVNYRYLVIKIPAFVLFFLLIRRYLHIRLRVHPFRFRLFNCVLLFLAVASVFAHCYIMGEICTFRGLLFLGMSSVYFVFAMATNKILNPLKLFIS